MPVIEPLTLRGQSWLVDVSTRRVASAYRRFCGAPTGHDAAIAFGDVGTAYDVDSGPQAFRRPQKLEAVLRQPLRHRGAGLQNHCTVITDALWRG